MNYYHPESEDYEIQHGAYQDERFGKLRDAHRWMVILFGLAAQEKIIVLTFEEQKIIQRIATKMHECCSHPVVVCDDNEQIRISEARCKCRLCPLCFKARCRSVFIKILHLVQTFDSARFITLTPVSNDLPLRQQISDMRAAFAKLRRTKRWKSKVINGVYTIEITYNRKTKRWHPHLHLIVDGEYYEKRELSRDWLQATGNASIVAIKSCPSRKNVAKYISSYVSKSSDISSFPKAKQVEWSLATHGQRLVQTFGKKADIRIDDGDYCDEDSEHITTELADVRELNYASRCGDDVAKRLMRRVMKMDKKRSFGDEKSQRNHRNAVKRLREDLLAWSGWDAARSDKAKEAPAPRKKPKRTSGYLFKESLRNAHPDTG